MELSAYANGGEPWREFLEAVPEELMDRGVLSRCGTGSLVCLRDAPVRYVHLVLSGAVSAQNITFNGKVSKWVNMPAPTFIGDMEVLADRFYYAADVAAVTDCVLAYWPVEEFMELALKYPRLLLLVSRILARKEYQLSISRGQAAFLSNLERTALYLLRYCEGAGLDREGRYIVRKTRNEISSEVFFSPKTLERCLYRLRDEGMLSICKGKVHVSQEQLGLLRKFRDNPDSI